MGSAFRVVNYVVGLNHRNGSKLDRKSCNAIFTYILFRSSSTIVASEAIKLEFCQNSESYDRRSYS